MMPIKSIQHVVLFLSLFHKDRLFTQERILLFYYLSSHANISYFLRWLTQTSGTHSCLYTINKTFSLFSPENSNQKKREKNNRKREKKKKTKHHLLLLLTSLLAIFKTSSAGESVIWWILVHRQSFFHQYRKPSVIKQNRWMKSII